MSRSQFGSGSLDDGAAFLRGVGRRIMMARSAEYLSQSDLARAVGMSQSQISDIERGERSLRVDQLRAIAFMLRVSMAHLLGE
jgi:transcriptional regulator with XRE-family HTH domain